MPAALVIAIGGNHYDRQIGAARFDLAQQGQPVHSEHVDVRKNYDQLEPDPVRQSIEGLLAGACEVQHVGALPHLAPKAPAKHFGNIARRVPWATLFDNHAIATFAL